MARFLPLSLPEPKLDSCNVTLSEHRDGAPPFMFSFENYMAAERFAPYKSARPTAVQQRELYRWNSQLSQEMNKAIGHAEIFIREAIDQQLRAWTLKQPQRPGSTHNRTGAPLHRRDPRRRPSGGSEEWLKHPSQKLTNLIFSKRGNKLISEYDTAFFRAQQDLNARVLSRPRHSAAISTTVITAASTSVLCMTSASLRQASPHQRERLWIPLIMR